jgi:peptide/nickel transport system permease protein
MRGVRGLTLALGAWVAWALVGLVWTPHDPRASAYFEAVGQGASWSHWMGVDPLGRDVFSRVWVGSGHTVVLGGAAAAGALLLAALMLLVEQRGPRMVRPIVRSLAAAGLALPVMFVGMLLLVFLPASSWTLVFACALGGVPFAFRQLHIVWLEQAGALHVTASRALGAGWRHLLAFSIWPNLRPQAAALARLLFAASVLELSGLSFLGLAGDPDQAELGVLLRRHQAELFQQPMLVVWPGLFLSGMLLLVHLANVRGAASRERGLAG